MIICTTKSISLCSGLVLWLCTHIALTCHICLHWRLGLCLLMPLNKHFTPKEAFKSRVTIYFPPEMSTSTLWRSQTVLILEHTSFCLISVRVRCPPPPLVLRHIPFEIFLWFDKSIWWLFLVDLQINSSTFKKKKHLNKKTVLDV